MFCKNCGKPIDNDSKFCMYCGSNLAKDTSVLTKEDETHNNKRHSTPLTSSTAFGISDKYDTTFKKDDSLTTIGIVMIIVFIIGSITMQSEISEMNLDDFRTMQVVASIVSLAIRIFIVGVVAQYASKLNRDSFIWGLFAFFLPAISLIVIGQQKKLKYKS